MSYRVFISHKQADMNGSDKNARDYELAVDLHDALTEMGITAFLSEIDADTGDYVNEICDALEEADVMVVVGTRPEYVRSRWVREEWTAFLALMNGERKPHGEIYTYLEGMSINDLPSMLYKRQSYTPSQKEKLLRKIRRQVGVGKMAQRVKEQTVCVGRRMTFGKYPQGAKGEIAPLEWRVLDVLGDRALLITDKLIDSVPYNHSFADMTWETSSLRRWLNGDFFETAFTPDERSRVLMSVRQNPDNPKYGTAGGKATEERVFALSLEEARRYFRNDRERMTAVTEYCVSRGCFTSPEYSLSDRQTTGWWWLRSPGWRGAYAAAVDLDGYVNGLGARVNNEYSSVRPALWLAVNLPYYK